MRSYSKSELRAALGVSKSTFQRWMHLMNKKGVIPDYQVMQRVFLPHQVEAIAKHLCLDLP